MTIFTLRVAAIAMLCAAIVLFVTSVRILYHETRQPNVIVRTVGDGQVKECTDQGGDFYAINLSGGKIDVTCHLPGRNIQL